MLSQHWSFTWISRQRFRLRQRTKSWEFCISEELETRWLPANIAVTDAFLIDGDGDRIASPMLGERLAVKVEFDTRQLGSSASYRVRFEVDGVALVSDAIDYGAGFNSGSWYRTQYGWFAESLGKHSVTVAVDSANTISETIETDNSSSFQFTTVRATPPVQFSWPMDGVPMQDQVFINYLDLDPTSGIRDWNGGKASYDGHEGLDFGGPTNADLDRGLVIRAAAPGTVIAAVDGNFDRNHGTLKKIVPGGDPNYVQIDHGDGWVTEYLHLRRDSVAVKVGDVVARGDILGFEGSSGYSTGGHLHFGVQHNRADVETFLDPTTYWTASPPYVLTTRYLNDAGITNEVPAQDLNISERPSEVEIYRQAIGLNVNAWGYFTGLRKNDELQAVYLQPDGIKYATNTLHPDRDYSVSYWYFTRTLTNIPAIGTWTVQFVVNGAKLGERHFEVTQSGAPEITVRTDDGSLVADERFTPFNLGSASQGITAPTQTFTVTNHGSATLTLGQIDLPAGFNLIEGLPASLPAGTSDSFTVGLDTSTAGYFAGQVRIPSNDISEAKFNFSIEGTVTSAKPVLALGLSTRHTPEGSQIVSNLRRTGSLSQTLTVNLTSSDITAATVPTSVTIPAGAASVLFEITAVSDASPDATQITTITATATGYSPASNDLDVTDDVSTPVDDPLILSLDDRPLNYLVSSRKSAPIDPASTLTGGTQPSIDWSKILLTITGHTKKDSLSILKQAGISKSGKNLRFNGTTIGSIAGGTSGNPLVITFNDQATTASVQFLLRAIAFKSTDKIAGSRNLKIKFTDFVGSINVTDTRAIQVTPR